MNNTTRSDRKGTQFRCSWCGSMKNDENLREIYNEAKQWVHKNDCF